MALPARRAGPAWRGGLGLIVAAACLWGGFGLFVRVFQRHGLDPLTMTFWRAAAGLAVTLAFLLATGRLSQLRVTGRQLGQLGLYGLLSTALFPLCYFLAISELPVAVAGVLLYTSPVYVVLLAVPLFGERLTGRKLAAVAIALVGTALVAGLGAGAGSGADSGAGYGAGFGAGDGAGYGALGLGAGLMAGLTYALLSLGGKLLGRSVPPDTVMCYAYTAGVAALGIAVPGAWRAAPTFPPAVWVAIALMGIGPTFLAYRLFLRGMERVEASVAGVVTTVEPVVAALLGTFVLREPLGLWQVAGGLLVLSAVIMLQWPSRQRYAAEL